MWLTWSPLTIPYTHRTISLAPHCRSSIWPMDHIVLFPFLSSFSITQLILLWADRSQAIALHGQDLTICFTTHKPCACFTYHLYLKLLYLLQKRRKSFPQNSNLVHSALLFCLIPFHTSTQFHTSNSLCTLAPSWTLALHCLALLTVMLGDHPLPPDCTLRAPYFPYFQQFIWQLSTQISQCNNLWYPWCPPMETMECHNLILTSHVSYTASSKTSSFSLCDPM